jgi:hypothetical protein
MFVGEHTAELQAIHQDVVPWQQQAINEVTSHAVEVATNTEAAINHLQENRNRLFVSEYRSSDSNRQPLRRHEGGRRRVPRLREEPAEASAARG